MNLVQWHKFSSLFKETHILFSKNFKKFEKFYVPSSSNFLSISPLYFFFFALIPVSAPFSTAGPLISASSFFVLDDLQDEIRFVYKMREGELRT